jgi:group II intron reverse transcriptase/maturase
MHREGADGPVVATNSGNAEGVKGSDGRAAESRQPRKLIGEERGAPAKAFDIPKQLVVEAYRRVKANRGAAGVDGETLRQFEADRKNQLYKIWNRLSSGSYFPPPVRLVEIEKEGGGIRPLGIPTVADRIAQAVVKLVLEPGVDSQFHVDSYGYRPGKSAHAAVAQARRRCWTYDWVVDLDIKGFFDNLPHDLVERAVARHTRLPWVRLYVARWLRAPVQRPDGTQERRDRGTPQGGVISPLLANLFLHYALDRWLQREYPIVPFERYADDMILHCRSEQEAQRVLAAVRERLAVCGLELHPTKTRIVYCKDGRRRRQYEHVSFDFLSYTFRARPARRRHGTVFLGFLPAMSRKVAKGIRQAIAEWRLTSRSEQSLREIASLTNATVRGWMNYYGRFYRSECQRVLQSLNHALVRWAHRKFKDLRRCSLTAAREWLRRVALRDPAALALWQSGVIPYARR